MSYRNKTYVIFDGDNDMWAYAYMKGWKKNENINKPEVNLEYYLWLKDPNEAGSPQARDDD